MTDNATVIPLAEAEPEKLLAAICDLIRRQADATDAWPVAPNSHHMAERLRDIVESCGQPPRAATAVVVGIFHCYPPVALRRRPTFEGQCAAVIEGVRESGANNPPSG